MKRWASGYLCVLATIMLAGTALAADIHVPADQPTIQDGIDAVRDGDTVIVSPGTYYENINFDSKVITIRSIDNPNATIIYGGGFDEPAFSLEKLNDK